MTYARRRWFSFLADWAIRMKRDQLSRDEVIDRMKKMDFDTDTSKMGVRMTETLRDRLRRKWLKLKRTE